MNTEYDNNITKYAFYIFSLVCGILGIGFLISGMLTKELGKIIYGSLLIIVVPFSLTIYCLYCRISENDNIIEP